jgi:hypothetical protein
LGWLPSSSFPAVRNFVRGRAIARSATVFVRLVERLVIEQFVLWLGSADGVRKAGALLRTLVDPDLGSPSTTVY